MYGTGVVQLPNLEELDRGRRRALGTWTYLLVAVLAFLETGAFVGLIAPGETTIIFGGVVAGQGEISLLVLIAIVWACAVAGDRDLLLLGRRLGREFLERHGPRVRSPRSACDQVERFFDRHGGVDDPDRALRRARARAGAVHRRRVADAARGASCPTT